MTVRLLQRMSPVVAQSGHTETICYLSAFGAKRTRFGQWQRQGARPRRSGERARQRQRGDRIRAALLRLLTTGSGTKRTCRPHLLTVRFRREADMP
jgi:hypothetical protein